MLLTSTLIFDFPSHFSSLTRVCWSPPKTLCQPSVLQDTRWSQHKHLQDSRTHQPRQQIQCRQVGILSFDLTCTCIRLKNKTRGWHMQLLCGKQPLMDITKDVYFTDHTIKLVAFWKVTVLCAVYYSLRRRRSPPASWTGAAVALAALRTVRPLAEPLTSGAESRPQYQPPPTWLLLMSHGFREFTLVYSSGLLLTSSGACSASFNLRCVSPLFIRSILWFKEFPLMNNTEWTRVVFIRNHVVIMICPNC